MDDNKLRVAIFGAAGYGGGELLRLLQNHPDACVTVAISDTYAGRTVSTAFPGLAGISNLVFVGGGDISAVDDCDIAFLARDNGQAMKLAPELVAAGVKVVDLSADFRFRDAAKYETWYGVQHAAPRQTARAVYGLPELHADEIREATIVGNPGCFTTASILALAPLAAGGLLKPDTVIIDGKSGVSGAGRSKFGLDYHFSEVNENTWAYKVAGTHRHTGEIEQELSNLCGGEIVVTFTPHVVPMTRGILATCYANLTQYPTSDELEALYVQFYAAAPFVHVTEGLPATKHTLATNMCHLKPLLDNRTGRVTIVSCIDNLGKGMAGQAIQNMNLMFGLNETAGLLNVGVWP